MSESTIEEGVAGVLAQLLGEDLRTESAIRHALKTRVLTLDDDLDGSQKATRERFAASSDPFEQAASTNPAMLGFIRARYGGDAAALDAARQRSEQLVNTGNLSELAEVLNDPQTHGRLGEAILLYPFNHAALQVFFTVFFFSGQVLAAMRIALHQLLIDPSASDSRFSGAMAAEQLGWHEEAVRLLATRHLEASLGVLDPLPTSHTLRIFVEQLIAWFDDHFSADRPGLVGEMRAGADGPMLFDPFWRLDTAMTMMEKLAESPGGEVWRKDRAWCEAMRHRIEELRVRAVETGRLPGPGSLVGAWDYRAGSVPDVLEARACSGPESVEWVHKTTRDDDGNLSRPVVGVMDERDVTFLYQAGTSLLRAQTLAERREGLFYLRLVANEQPRANQMHHGVGDLPARARKHLDTMQAKLVGTRFEDFAALIDLDLTELADRVGS